MKKRRRNSEIPLEFLDTHGILDYGMRIYLDVCCLNRPFDDQGQVRVRLEAEAVLTILSLIQAKKWRMVISPAIEYEIANLQDAERKKKVEMILSLKDESLKKSHKVEKQAKELENQGINALDAFHLAFAKEGKVDVFLTTDDKIISKARRIKLGLEVKNPVEWLMEVKI